MPVDAAWLTWTWLTVAGVLAGAACARDKRRARRGGRRVPENVLLALALLGGSPGLALCMSAMRHKTAKASFLAKFAAVVALQLAAALLLAQRL